MPEPRISSQPLCPQTRQPRPPHMTQRISTSADGSVKGKKLGRNRNVVSVPENLFKKSCQNSFEVAKSLLLYPPAVLQFDETSEYERHRNHAGKLFPAIKSAAAAGLFP